MYAARKEGPTCCENNRNSPRLNYECQMRLLALELMEGKSYV